MKPRADSVARYRAAFAERNLVAEIEALLARSWPPLTLLDLDGWQVRSAGGLTLRANSVWPRADGARLSVAERLQQVEAFYRQGGALPVVQVSPSARPRGLESALRQHGYRSTRPAEVRTCRADQLAEARDGPTGELVDREGWLAAWGLAAGATDHHLAMAARILERVSLPSAFAVLTDGTDVAVARGVVDGGWLGIDLLAATAALRTGSAGRVLLAELARWALRRGAEHVHIEVGDTASAELARGRGFRRAYALGYMVKPASALA